MLGPKAPPLNDIVRFCATPENHQATYYLNTAYAGLILEKLGWAPPLPEDGIERITAWQMLDRLYGGQNRAHMPELLRELDRIAASDTRFAVTVGQEVRQCRADEVEGYYACYHGMNGKNVTRYVAAGLEGHLRERLAIIPAVPRDKKHFLSEKRLALEACGSATAGDYREVIRCKLEQLRAQDYLWLRDGQSENFLPVPACESIGYWRGSGTSGTGYWADPRLREFYLSDDKIRQAVHDRWSAKEKEAGREWPAQMPTELPKERDSWLSPYNAARRLGAEGKHFTNAMIALLKERFDAGDERVGFHFRARGDRAATFFCDPPLLGSEITPTVLRCTARERQNRNTGEVFHDR